MVKAKNIIFDLGGVLLNLDFQRTTKAFSEIGLSAIEDLFRLGHADSFFKHHERGAISDEEFITAIKNLPGNKGTIAQIKAAWNALLLDFPKERVLWLGQLKHKYRLFLFSNTNAIHLASFQQSFKNVHGFQMDELFERTYYSHLAKIRKPEPAAYELVLKENLLKAEETLFIDDALINVEAAHSIKIQGIHLQPGVEVTSLVL